MNVAQISTGLTGRGAGLLTNILELKPFLRFAEFKHDTSDYITIPDKDTHTGSARRAEGDNLQVDNQAPTPTARKLALYGREITIDDVRRQDANVVNSPEALRQFTDRRLPGLASKLSDEVVADMFNGTDADNQMLGFSTFVKDAAAGGQTAKLGFTAAEQAAMNEQISLQINTDENQKSFVEKLMKALAKVPGANAIICNQSLYARMTTIAKTFGAAGEKVDSFGIPAKTFDGKPIIPVEDTEITMTESDGTNNDCTSLYIVRFAESLGTSFSTNSGFFFTDFDFSEVAPKGKARLQFFLNLTVEKANSIRRLSRIRL
jgi:hypothetical protein